MTKFTVNTFYILLCSIFICNFAHGWEDRPGREEEMRYELALFKRCQIVTSAEKHESTLSVTSKKDGSPPTSKREILKSKKGEKK